MKVAPVHGHAIDEELDTLRLPSTSTTNSTTLVKDNRTDFKVVYVNGCDDVTMTGDQNGQDKNNAVATIFGAVLLFMSAVFAKIFHGLNRCRPVRPAPPDRNEETSLSAVEVERIEDELRKTPKKPQKANAPVY
ncbi:uncharacterized protein LOC100909102 [Galendromus occidentalis]|uniref:Uncharacterized protein LOC100909102 n=1 Tax=Galendromus occidentalis TaxID=34638 RepID=A0AAJ6VVG1_9ACAR|nr:uncharacterized protein LOC100909102 [Galendromus occidentalis]